MRRVGFVGLGVMGTPIARNLIRAGQPLLVWNRSPAAAETLRAEGADVAASVEDLFSRTDVVLLMLANGDVVDAVLGRRTARFEELVRGRLVVPMGTTPPAYSEALGRDVLEAGGRYAEAPVSGSRLPAEQGRLVAMLGGEEADLDVVEPLLASTCASVVRCGPVPSGLRMKLAVNLYLVTTVCGLVESYHFAERLGLDLDRFVAVLDGGQMASPISRTKLAKLRAGDLSVQAAIADVLYNARLVTDAAADSGVATPLAAVSEALYAEATALGHGGVDMAGVIRAIEARTMALRTGPPSASSS